MAKNRNKGFSLIEIIVAIAILTLLITPVVGQFSQTIKTNRKAKEQQKATENANYVIEYFQKTSIKDTVALTSTDQDAYCIKDDDGKIEDVKEVTCKLYAIDPTDGSANQVGEVKYTATKYTLNEKEIYGDVTYTRTVVLDDLSNKIMATEIGATKDSYRVKYDNTEAINDFELTNEGSLVQRDDNGYVVGIVCYKLDTANVIQDPNTISTGNMHDLDSKYVALITGNSTNFDEQAEKALYAKAVNRLKEINEDLWKQQVYGENEGILNSYGYMNGLKKLTKMYIDEGTDATGDYYIIKVDVYYENEVSNHSESDNADAGEVSGSTNKDDAAAGVQLTSSGNDSLTYNVFSQKFYKKYLTVDKCPDIYFEYQPFVTDKSYDKNGNCNGVTYSSNEYILMDNYVDDVKIYFYKPKYDQSYVAFNGKPTNVVPSDTDTIEMSKYNFYKVDNDATDLSDVEAYAKKDNVKINFCNSHADNDKKNLHIYTNLDVAINGTNPQFVTGSTYDVFKDAAQTEGTSTNARVSFNESNGDYIQSLDKDISLHERIYTITVTLTPDDDYYNTIVLTGAKEEN